MTSERWAAHAHPAGVHPMLKQIERLLAALILTALTGLSPKAFGGA